MREKFRAFNRSAATVAAKSLTLDTTRLPMHRTRAGIEVALLFNDGGPR
jgi:hypothetical protein